jgi:hypothetical protein
MSRRGGGQFPDEDERDGSRNVCFLAIKSPVAAASHRICYWICRRENFKL